MPTDWSDNVVIGELGDEPLLGEELASIFQRLKSVQGGGAPAPHVVLNFSSVTYLNSSHLAQLLRLNRLAQERGRLLMLCALADTIWSVMLMTGLDRVFRVAPDMMTALASVQLADEKRSAADA
ncbi:MAG: STAS domain-containing protein [Phycisphaerae bacterium]|nr:STAS domain-containing protein [Phycisphaerae bacterium]